MRVWLKATVAIAPSTNESTTQDLMSGTTQDLMSGTTVHRVTPRPSERHDACCRRSSVIAVWPCASAHCSAVLPRLSGSSVLAPAASRAFTHASCPW